MRIHPTAVVDPKAVLGDDCEVGPGAVIEAEVVMGNRCRVGPNAFVGRFTKMGDDNLLHIGAVVGHVPQDLSYDSKTVTHCKVGDGNVFREYCVIHRSAKDGGATIIGDRNFFMNHSHVGHDAKFGNEIILGASALIAGYVQVGDRAYFSGNTAVHQFCRVGRLGMLRGVSGVSMDIPPFCIADWHNTLRGINVVGLRRAGISDKSREALRAVFRQLFRSGDALAEAINKVANGEYGKIPEVVELLTFCRESKRGIVSWRQVVDNGAADASTENGGADDY